MIQRRWFLKLSAAGAGCLLWRDEARSWLHPGGVPALRVQPQRGASRSAFDAFGAAWEVEPHAGRVVERGPLGIALRAIGEPGSGPAQLNQPRAIGFGPDENLYVLDSGNSRIQVFDRRGVHVRQLGCPGGGDGELRAPRDLAFDREGRLWVADTSNHRISVFDLLGKASARTAALGDGRLDLNAPCALAFAPDGRLHVLDAGNRRVSVFSPNGLPQGSYGEGTLQEPSALALAADGCAYVADRRKASLEVFEPGGRHLRELRAHFADGSAAAPQHVCFAPDGELHVDARRAACSGSAAA
ncbi:MAG TPA: NHL repeat-containing protein [Polyangiales bacterium]|nr:NHL repeat-containing protein [Polyangiales bacterium]